MIEIEDATAAMSETIPRRRTVYRTVEQLESIASDWRQLQERAEGATVYTTFEWMTCWWRAFAKDWDMRVVAIWEGADLVAVAPLFLRVGSLFRRRTRVLSCWTNSHTPRNDILVAPSSSWALEMIADYLVSDDLPRWNTFHFNVMLTDGAAGQLVQCLDRRGCLMVQRPHSDSPYLKIPTDWKTLEAGLSKSMRKKTRQRSNRFKKNDSITCDNGSMEDASLVAEKSWQHLERGTSISSDADPEQKMFYKLLAAATEKRGWLRLPILRFDSKPVAFQYNLEYRGVSYHLKTGFDEDHSKQAPGATLFIAVLQKMVAEGMREFDFAGNATPHKLQWTKLIRPHLDFMVFSPHATDRVRYCLFQVKPMIKHIPMLTRINRNIRSRLGTSDEST